MNILKRTVLIIDGNSDMRAVVGNILFKEYNVVTKKDELEAFAWLQKGNLPSSIILGLESEIDPKKSFLINLQSTGFYSELPIIVLSACEKESFRADLTKLGAFAILGKPFDPSVLKSNIAATMPALQEIIPVNKNIRKSTPELIYNLVPNFREAVTGAMLLFINQYF